jgi:formamidopyrimidine-DNA glycosylase
MPELPEVETVVAGLNRTVLGKSFSQIKVLDPRILNSDLGTLKRKLPGQRIKQVSRRGKYILFSLSHRNTLLAHLGMTGHLFYYTQPARVDKHDVAIFKFRGCKAELHFHDIRRFGKLAWFNHSGDSLPTEKLGPEPLQISFEEFVRLFRSRKRTLKPAILDQSFIAGLGNIYADEALFNARIHPLVSTDRLSKDALNRLYLGIRKTLKHAIKTGGSSVVNYAGVDGKRGHFQIHHKVYGKEGKPCPRCGAKIKRILLGQRSTHFCPRCQRKR